MAVLASFSKKSREVLLLTSQLSASDLTSCVWVIL